MEPEPTPRTMGGLSPVRALLLATAVVLVLVLAARVPARPPAAEGYADDPAALGGLWRTKNTFYWFAAKRNKSNRYKIYNIGNQAWPEFRLDVAPGTARAILVRRNNPSTATAQAAPNMPKWGAPSTITIGARELTPADPAVAPRFWRPVPFDGTWVAGVTTFQARSLAPELVELRRDGVRWALVRVAADGTATFSNILDDAVYTGHVNYDGDTPTVLAFDAPSQLVLHRVS